MYSSKNNLLEYSNIEKFLFMTECKLKLGQFLKTQKKRNELTRVLIVENMQNCFFDKGAMGFMSKNSKDEKIFLERINKLINFQEEDEDYIKAGLSGKEIEGRKLNPLLVGEFKTGARPKYYFDMVVFTQIANPPDHFSFSSHYFLENPGLFKPFSSKGEGTAYITSKSKLKQKGKKKLYLHPDYALTDGADSYVAKGKNVKGIDFHIDLDTSSLNRPNQDYNPNVFINSPRYYNRGYILTKGNDNSNNHSAFFNSDKKSTGLIDFLRCNKVNSIAVCGMGREDSIYHTMLDSLKIDFINERILLHDATKPINIDLARFKKKPKLLEAMRSDNIEGNRFLKKYMNKGIKVYNSNNLFIMINDIEKKANMNDMGRLAALERTFEGSESSGVSDDNLNSLRSDTKASTKKKKKKKKKKKTKKK